MTDSKIQAAVCADIIRERDEFRAENERLRTQVNDCRANDHYRAWQESDVENDQWQKKLAEVWAELARLRDTVAALAANNVALVRENHGSREAFYRGALEQIVRLQHDSDAVLRMVATAETALQQARQGDSCDQAADDERQSIGGNQDDSDQQADQSH